MSDQVARTRWAKANADGPSHAWPAGQDGVLSALCGVEAEAGELVDTRDDGCHRCLLAHGTTLADRSPVSRWSF
ncbi:MAG TPA: hypothetical protein VHX38_02220 [Pseudonocardiaceae bacterium]|jgi:hypothetical protein|nr:hypothetical protein [Pseudonocardiaceae bacterium]